MRRACTCGSLGLVVSLALALSSHAAAGQRADKCIRYWDEVRYGALAFNHIVHVANSCPAVADCVVSTDVNPEPQDVEVGGHSEVEVVTFIGSPARTFQSRVKCTMRD
jgi:hypothetical protein